MKSKPVSCGTTKQPGGRNPPVLETLGRTTWDKIKINEVFAMKGCWAILVKLGEDDSMMLATDHKYWNFEDGLVGEYKYAPDFLPLNKRTCEVKFHDGYFPLYKLPLATQRLWRED